MRKINRNKKGIFFTLAAIALSIIILFSFNTYNDYRLKDNMEAIEIRVDTMNSFVQDLEDDIGNGIFISGFRSLLSLEDYMMSKDKFFDDAAVPVTPELDDAFDEVFRLGTIDSEIMDLMENNTFINWTEKIKVQANKTDITLKFTINSVTITQSEPWMVDINVKLKIDVQDKKGVASWTIDKTEGYTKKINITAFVDPLYIVNNHGLVNNTMTMTTVPAFTPSSNLETHLLNSYYVEHSDAPSYLMRFENVLTSSAYGIESLVNVQELIDAGLSTSSRSAVDYIYYDTSITTDCQVEEPVYSWFYLDSDHLSFYKSDCI